MCWGCTTSGLDDGYDESAPEAIQFAEWLKTDAEERFRQRSSEEWLELLESRGVPASPVKFVEELFDDPQGGCQRARSRSGTPGSRYGEDGGAVG